MNSESGSRWIGGASRRLALAAALVALPAAAQGAEQEVKEAEGRRFAAMVAADRAELDRLLADDLTYAHSSGEVESKAQFLDSVTSGRLDYLSIEPEEVRVRVYGDTAVVTGRAAVKLATQGQERTITLRYTDVWVQRDGRWRMVAWQSTRLPEPQRPPG